MIITTGQIFFSLGIAGILSSAIAAIIVLKWLKRKERAIKEEIWKEYK